MSHLPNQNSQDQVELIKKKSDVWTQHAKVYDSVFRPILEHFSRDAITLSGLGTRQSLRVLDVACGSGGITLPLLEKGHIVTATDFSTGMLDIVRYRATEAGFKDLNTILADGQTLEGIPDAQFDVVVSSFGIFLFPDRIQGWKSANRVLKAGGVLATLSWKKESPSVLIMDRVLSITKAFDSENATLDLEGFKNEVSACGFLNVSTTEIRHEFCFSSGQILLDSFFAFDIAGREKVSKEVSDFLGLSVDEFLEKPVHYEGIALLCLATKPL